MKYFTECTTIEELKKAYRTACMKLHPDLNGNATEEEFKKMNAEYNECLKTLGKRSNFANAESDDAPFDWTNDKFAEIIQKIVTFDGIRIEVIGTWIWVFDSFAYRNELKNLGFWFSGSKKAWVFSGMAKTKSRGRYSLNQLRELHGSHDVETVGRKKIC